MANPGPHNLITDVDGIAVGNAEDTAARTGVTVVLPDEAATVAVDMRGGAPGTRESDALDPTCLVDRVDAVVLSGGSVFGLDAAAGVTAGLAARDRGFSVGAFHLPIVPGAILFDLTNGGAKDWGEDPPYRALGKQALAAVAQDFRMGNAGAGLGASAGRLKGGLGSVSAVTDDGIQVGALFAANPVGATTIPGTSVFWAWALERNGELGNQNAPESLPDIDLDLPSESRIGTNTTIGIVATNVALDKAQALRVAIMAHDGLARAIRPVHTPFDGDTVYVMSTGAVPLEEPKAMTLARIGSMAADCTARAIARGVYEADSLGDMPGYRSVRQTAQAAG